MKWYDDKTWYDLNFREKVEIFIFPGRRNI